MSQFHWFFFRETLDRFSIGSVQIECETIGGGPDIMNYPRVIVFHDAIV